MSGPIPAELGNLTQLLWLYLHWNALTGPIPPSLGNLSSLQRLGLDANQLSGSIPPSLGNLSSLLTLGLGGNQLTGTIPKELGNLSGLWFLGLASNQLVGVIPPELASLTSLYDGSGLDLRWNALHSSDPTLRSFLALKQSGGDWESTQTVAPTGLAAGGAALDSVPLSWSPILYTGDTGGYRIWYGTQAGGPYDLGGATADKAASTAAVGGLSPGTTYYCSPSTRRRNPTRTTRTPW